MGQGIGLNDEVSATLTASIDLPSDSGDWVFYGASYDATDDTAGEVGPVQIVTTNGTHWISSSTPSMFAIAHAPGTPLSVSIDISDYVEQAQSSNNFDFELRMVDPVAVPEPATWLLIVSALSLLFVLRTPQLPR